MNACWRSGEMGPPGIRKILVVKLSALGDVVHALPVVDYLRKKAPGAQVDWVVERRFAPLLERNPGLRRVIPLDLKAWKRQWTARDARREAGEAVRNLRDGKYDLAFDIQGNAKSGVVTRLSGAPLRYGFDRQGVREVPNLLFTNRKIALQPEDRHVSQKYLRVVGAPFGNSRPARRRSWSFTPARPGAPSGWPPSSGPGRYAFCRLGTPGWGSSSPGGARRNGTRP